MERKGEGRSVLITGCSSGIGRVTAEVLRGRGYRVFASARKEADVAALRGEGFEAVRLDLTDPESIREAVDWVLAQTGGTLDALFNNGAYGQPGAVEDLTLAALREQFETNLFGTHELTRRVIPVMRRQGHGRIIQNSSVLGFVALAYRGAYVASKHALEGLSDALRLELRGSGIQVVLVEPGPIVTRFRRNAYEAFCRHVEAGSSVHGENYARMNAKRLASREEDEPFVLPPEAVARVVVRALESRRPALRYRVTFPTRLFAGLKRLLPGRLLDALLVRV